MKRSHNLSRSRFSYVAAALSLIGPGSYLVVGCGGNQTVNLILQIITVLITRSAGGIVSLQNATLNVPAGAVTSDTEVTLQVTSTPPASTSSYTVVPATAFTITPASLTFSAPATLTIGYKPTNLPAGASASNLVLYRITPAGAVAVPGSAVNTANRTVSAPISALGSYVVALTSSAI